MAGALKYQVFISSTYDDLKDERDQVIRAVLEMGHIPVGMEMFSAADDEQWQIIARHIEESDYYAVIIAHRLGSMADSGLSYTRKEYEHAIAKGVPVLGFVLDDKAAWPADRIDVNDSTIQALLEFKTLVKSKPVSFWSTAEDLYGRFSVALMKAFTANPREGWVRTSSASGGPEVTAEVIRLSSENAVLRQRLIEAREASGKEQQDEILRTISNLLNTKRKPSYRYTAGGEWSNDSEITLFTLFSIWGPEVIVESTVRELSKILAMTLRVDRDRTWDIVALNQVRNLLADLMVLDVVQPSSRKHAVSDKEEYWQLSPYGRDVLKSVRKVALSKTEDASPPSDETSDSSDEPTSHQ